MNILGRLGRIVSGMDMVIQVAMVLNPWINVSLSMHCKFAIAFFKVEYVKKRRLTQ